MPSDAGPIGGTRHPGRPRRARNVPERESHHGQSRCLTDNISADPQVSQSAGDESAAPQASQADSPTSDPKSSLRGTYVGCNVAVDRSRERHRRPQTIDRPELWRSVKPCPMTGPLGPIPLCQATMTA